MKVDAIVVGGSFGGLSAAMQLARARRRVLVVDAGMPRNRFAKASHGFFGLDGVSRKDIKAHTHAQLSAYPTVTVVEGIASTAKQTATGFSVTLGDGSVYEAQVLILATGLRDTLPDIPGLQERWGKTVAHCPYCHGYEMGGVALGAIATSPMSAHQAAMLPDWGSATYFTQGQFMPDEEQQGFLEQRGVSIEHTPVVEVLGQAPAITGVRLQDGRELALGGLFVGPRTSMASPLAEQLGCVMEDAPNNPVVQTDAIQRTSIKGVFAAGDMANPMQNATLASASGMMAGIGAHRALMGFD